MHVPHFQSIFIVFLVKDISDLGAGGTSLTGFARPAVVTLQVNGQERSTSETHS